MTLFRDTCSSSIISHMWRVWMIFRKVHTSTCMFFRRVARSIVPPARASMANSRFLRPSNLASFPPTRQSRCDEANADPKQLKAKPCWKAPETIDVCRPSVAPAHLPAIDNFFRGWRGHPAPRSRKRPRRGATRSRTPTRRTRSRWRRASMPRREIMRKEARERLFSVSSSESRT